MKRKSISWITAALLCVAFPGAAKSGMLGGIEIGDEGVRSFYLAVGDFYGVSDQQVVVVHQRHIPDDEIPVVFFLASRARVAPDVIIGLRLGGSSWMQICSKYNITADVFYVPVSGTPGPPYGKAYGHYKNKDKSKWKEIRLSDADVINLVNLRFVSEHQRCSPNDVISARSGGSSFVKISHNIEKKRSMSKADSKDNSSSKSSGKKKH